MHPVFAGSVACVDPDCKRDACHGNVFRMLKTEDEMVAAVANDRVDDPLMELDLHSLREARHMCTVPVGGHLQAINTDGRGRAERAHKRARNEVSACGGAQPWDLTSDQLREFSDQPRVQPRDQLVDDHEQLGGGDSNEGDSGGGGSDSGGRSRVAVQLYAPHHKVNWLAIVGCYRGRASYSKSHIPFLHAHSVHTLKTCCACCLRRMTTVGLIPSSIAISQTLTFAM